MWTPPGRRSPAAEDTRLHRHVALEFVPEERSHDAQAVASGTRFGHDLEGMDVQIRAPAKLGAAAQVAWPRRS
jgi:hypothetical protein